MSKMKKILAYTLSILVTATSMSSVAYAIDDSSSATEASEPVIASGAYIPDGVDNDTDNKINDDSNTSVISDESKEELENIREALSKFMTDGTYSSCDVYEKEECVILASQDQTVLDNAMSYCKENNIDASFDSTSFAKVLLILEVEEDVTVTEPYIPDGVNVDTSNKTDNQKNTVVISDDLKKELESIQEKLYQFVNDGHDSCMISTEGYVIFSSFEQSTLDKVMSYCKENNIDASFDSTSSAKVLLILSVEEDEVIFGDVNGDNIIDSKDAVIVLKKYAENIVNGSELTDRLYDINKDGKVDSNDAVVVLKYYASSILEDAGSIEIYME